MVKIKKLDHHKTAIIDDTTDQIAAILEPTNSPFVWLGMDKELFDANKKLDGYYMAVRDAEFVVKNNATIHSLVKGDIYIGIPDAYFEKEPETLDKAICTVVGVVFKEFEPKPDPNLRIKTFASAGINKAISVYQQAYERSAYKPLSRLLTDTEHYNAGNGIIQRKENGHYINIGIIIARDVGNNKIIDLFGIIPKYRGKDITKSYPVWLAHQQPSIVSGQHVAAVVSPWLADYLQKLGMIEHQDKMGVYLLPDK